MRSPLKFALAFVAIAAVALGAWTLGSTSAFAGDEAPAAAPAAKVEGPAPTTPVATKTETPFHTILMYVGSQVCGGKCECASTPGGSAKWAAWFDAKDAVMPGLRAQLLADGWTKERFLGFFADMAKASGSASDSGCTGCKDGSCKDGGCKDGGCCGKCKTGEACDEGCQCPDKAKADGAPTGDVSGSASEAGGCDKGCCGCHKGKAKADGAAPTGDASGSASEAGGCDKGCCGGCTKDKDAGAAPTGEPSGSASDDGGCTKGCCGGCAKKKDTAPAPANG